MMTTLFEIVQNWLNQDPDAETHAELTALLSAAKGGDAKAEAELAVRFDGRYNSVPPVYAVACKPVPWG